MLPQLSDSAILGQHVDHAPFRDYAQHMAGKWEGAGCGGRGRGGKGRGRGEEVRGREGEVRGRVLNTQCC